MTKCETHPDYSGLRLGKKAKECPECVAFYEENRSNGVIESRNRGSIPKTDNGPTVSSTEESTSSSPSTEPEIKEEELITDLDL